MLTTFDFEFFFAFDMNKLIFKVILTIKNFKFKRTPGDD